MNYRVSDGNDSKHLLLAMAKTYPVSTPNLNPPGCHYSLAEGAWIMDDTGSLLADSPIRPMAATKKMDMETGEDQKGA